MLLNPNGTASRQDLLILYDAITAIFTTGSLNVYVREARVKLIHDLNAIPSPLSGSLNEVQGINPRG